MNGLRDFFAEFAYYCSSANQTSRGFYLAIAIGFSVAFLLTIAGFVCACIGLVTGAMRVVGFAGLPVVIVLAIITGIMLSKS